MPQYSESPGSQTSNSVTIPELNSDQPMVFAIGGYGRARRKTLGPARASDDVPFTVLTDSRRGKAPDRGANHENEARHARVCRL